MLRNACEFQKVGQQVESRAGTSSRDRRLLFVYCEYSYCTCAVTHFYNDSIELLRYVLDSYHSTPTTQLLPLNSYHSTPTTQLQSPNLTPNHHRPRLQPPTRHRSPTLSGKDFLRPSVLAAFGLDCRWCRGSNHLGGWDFTGDGPRITQVSTSRDCIVLSREHTRDTRMRSILQTRANQKVAKTHSRRSLLSDWQEASHQLKRRFD
ncbi:uncharacterized protein YALI1_A03017g [Yarrowia lipolytica]|uniref:Uncharacterized protein n=1 Tax=Yarrowia lipolytica TaxID=4952 RepID=A0A1D8N3G9_YARLL|nr:hypothetical protein YALI1_A03017g [Yarrowia lipolytica]